MEHHIALVDDHQLMRAGLASIINELDHYRVSLEASNGMEFIEQLGNGQLPAIAIIDLNMPVMDGYETLAWLREHVPTIMPLALTFDAHESAMLKAVHAGVRGFLLKSAPPEVLRKALDSLVLTGYYLNDATHDVLIRGPVQLS
jgi:DNA-binding NarL/FixJ family response regulator